MYELEEHKEAGGPDTAPEEYWGAYREELQTLSAKKHKGLFSVWSQQIDKLIDGFCSEIVHCWRKDHPSYQEFVLKAKLERTQNEIEYLKSELKRARSHDLENFIRRSDGFFASILAKSEEQLQSGLHFEVQKSEDGEHWEVVTGYCCLGGCDMGVYLFAAKRDALLYAAILDAVGYQPSHNIACPTCYAEYMKDCL